MINYVFIVGFLYALVYLNVLCSYMCVGLGCVVVVVWLLCLFFFVALVVYVLILLFVCLFYLFGYSTQKNYMAAVV